MKNLGLKSKLSLKWKATDDYMKLRDSENMTATLIDIMNARTYFGFTTGGHSGEEVFLAAYHPQGDVPMGMNTNVQINNYLYDVLGLKTPLKELTKETFSKHTDVFNGFEYEIDKTNEEFPVLRVKKDKNTLLIPAFKSEVFFNDKPRFLNSVTVYIDKNDTFYIPASLVTLFDK